MPTCLDAAGRGDPHARPAAQCRRFAALCSSSGHAALEKVGCSGARDNSSRAACVNDVHALQP
eukprot:9326802-Lingulodinium_polyedra.AAC.1